MPEPLAACVAQGPLSDCGLHNCKVLSARTQGGHLLSPHEEIFTQKSGPFRKEGGPGRAGCSLGPVLALEEPWSHPRDRRRRNLGAIKC